MLPKNSFLTIDDWAALPVPSLTSDESFCYVTVDMYSAPPTQLAICNTPHDVAQSLIRDPTVVPIAVMEVQFTKGWRDAVQAYRLNPAECHAIHKETLSVCFAHAFGKCHGRYRGDPATCQQLHIKPTSLAFVRSLYKHPQRRYFLRNFRATVPTDLIHLVSSIATRICWLQQGGAPALTTPPLPSVLDFASRDVSPTIGAQLADGGYRLALNAPGADATPQRYTLMLCTNFARSGCCPYGEDCSCLHARLHTTVTPYPHALDGAIHAIADAAPKVFVAGAAPLAGPPPPPDVDGRAANPSGKTRVPFSSTSVNTSMLQQVKAAWNAPLHQPSADPQRPLTNGGSAQIDTSCILDVLDDVLTEARRASR